MERILSLFVGCLVALLGFTATAQSTQVATLMSGDDVKIFMGPDALKEAVTASADGDVITLSAGSFDAPTSISKSLTIRGAGMGLEDIKPYVAPTIINGQITLSGQEMNFEGLRFQNTLSLHGNTTIPPSFTFTKCYCVKLGTTSSKNLNLIQSYINDAIYPDYDDIYALNSYVGLFNYNSHSRLNLLNCRVFINCTYAANTKAILNSTFTNCTIRNSNSSYAIVATSSCNYYNCIFYGPNADKTFDALNQNGTNKVCNDVTTIFKEEGFFELLDEYKTFKGTDGKEVGIYGGNLGFDTTPNNPQITRFNVSPKTSVDGKLSVEIEVKAAE